MTDFCCRIAVRDPYPDDNGDGDCSWGQPQGLSFMGGGSGQPHGPDSYHQDTNVYLHDSYMMSYRIKPQWARFDEHDIY